MRNKIAVPFTGLCLALILLGGSVYGQGRGEQPLSYTPTVTPYDKLPDWSGVWQMVGPTIFDTATQTGKGGSVDIGVREHPPYNAEWEAEYQKSLAKRDKARLPDVITNCGVPAGFPRMFNLPDTYEFVIR